MQRHETWWLVIPAVYATFSLISFAMYAVDKAAARRGHERIAESTLHLLDLLGGWPGGWVGQQAFRHKTSKHSFQKTYKWTIVLNVVLLGCLLFYL